MQPLLAHNGLPPTGADAPCPPRATWLRLCAPLPILPNVSRKNLHVQSGHFRCLPRLLQLRLQSVDRWSDTSRAFSNLETLFRAASRAASGLTLSLAEVRVGFRGCAGGCCTELGTVGTADKKMPEISGEVNREDAGN